MTVLLLAVPALAVSLLGLAVWRALDRWTVASGPPDEEWLA